MKAWSEEDTLAVAGVPMTEVNTQMIALANRYLEIHQGDPQKAGKALRAYLMRQIA